MYSKHACYEIKPTLKSTADTWQESGMKGEELGWCQILMREETWMEARLWMMSLLQQCCDHGWSPEVMIQRCDTSLLMISWWLMGWAEWWWDTSMMMLSMMWMKMQLWWLGDHWGWWAMAAGIWTRGASGWVIDELSNPGPHIGRQCHNSMTSNSICNDGNNNFIDDKVDKMLMDFMELFNSTSVMLNLKMVSQWHQIHTSYYCNIHCKQRT